MNLQAVLLLLIYKLFKNISKKGFDSFDFVEDPFVLHEHIEVKSCTPNETYRYLCLMFRKCTYVVYIRVYTESFATSRVGAPPSRRLVIPIRDETNVLCVLFHEYYFVPNYAEN